MIPFAWLLSLVFPACGASGAMGLPVPPMMDMAHLARPASPNTALAAPAGFAANPDLVTPDYAIAPQRLFADVGRVAAAEPRTYAAAGYVSALQAHWVVRSSIFNFPDLVTAQVLSGEAGGSRLVLYSRSVYGYSDLGANRQRLRAWLGAINRAVGQSAER